MTNFGIALIVAWWAVLVVAWSLFRVSARADRRIERMNILKSPPAGEAGDPAPGRLPPADERRGR